MKMRFCCVGIWEKIGRYFCVICWIDLGAFKFVFLDTLLILLYVHDTAGKLIHRMKNNKILKKEFKF